MHQAFPRRFVILASLELVFVCVSCEQPPAEESDAGSLGETDGGVDEEVDAGPEDCDSSLDRVFSEETDRNVAVTVEEIAPTSGPREGGFRARIDGSGFETCLRVYFDDEVAGGFTILSASSLSVEVPPSGVSRTIPILVVTPDGVGQKDDAFTYE